MALPLNPLLGASGNLRPERAFLFTKKAPAHLRCGGPGMVSRGYFPATNLMSVRGRSGSFLSLVMVKLISAWPGMGQS